MYHFSIAKIMKKQKEAKNSLYFFLFFLHFLSETACFTFRDARQKQLTSCGPLRGVKPTRGDHSLWPFSHGSRAC
jgi:hypothetical protein